MTIPKPEYHLHNHFDDGSESPCEILNVADAVNSAGMPRRNVLGASVALATVLTAIGIKTSHAADNTRRAAVHAHLDQISGLLIPPGSDTLISSSLDKQIKVWKLPSGELNRNLSQHNDAILTLSQSATGKLMVSGSRDGQTLLWNLPNASLHSRTFIHTRATHHDCSLHAWR